MIYLSWSIIHLITVLTLICIGTVVAYKRKVAERGKLLVVFLLLIVVNLYLAFDVGTRQQDLQRSSFNATAPTEAIGKTERKTLDRDAVKQNFENTIKETK